MDISFIDNLAYNTDSIMHRASALSKVAMVALVITTVVISRDAATLGFAFVALVATILISKLPLGRILALTAYAFFFSLIFAFSQVNGGIISGTVIVLKSVTAATSLLLLITTTPYPQIFALFQKVMPYVLVDIMLVTYRSFFLLIDQISSRITAIRIRGGYSSLGIAKNLSSIGRIIGHGVIHAWELSESMQNAMHVRGYSGRLPAGSSWRLVSKYDILPLAVGLIILALAVV